MKKYVTPFFSMLITSMLLVVFAVAIAYATFIENDYGTETAKVLVYNALWFNVLLGVIGVNLIGGLFYYKAFQLKRWSMVLFHLAFILILVGAAISRFYSYEGSLHIREGESNNRLVSDASFIQIEATKGQVHINNDWKVQLSPYTHPVFNEEVQLGEITIELGEMQYMTSAVETIVEDEGGAPVISFILVNRAEPRKDLVLDLNNEVKLEKLSVSFEGKRDDHTLYISRQADRLTMIYHDSMQVISMSGELGEVIAPGTVVNLVAKGMYQFGETIFVLKSYFPRGRKVLNSVAMNTGTMALDAVQLTVRANGEEKQLTLFGKKGLVGDPVTTEVGGIQMKLAFGSKIIHLPFEIFLNEFQLDRYPGSMSPSSYASQVTLMDKRENLKMPYRIFMNNILDYDGYRFFQSSYDQDEKGTVLSVSHDFAGTATTYLGYFLMTLGMVFTFFNKKSRIHELLRASSRLKELRKKTMIGGVLLLMIALPELTSAQQIKPARIDASHVSLFDELLVQDNQGRVKPVNTLASEVLRKLTKKNNFEGMSASEVFLGMSVRPAAWKNIPIIKVSNSELQKQLGITGKFTSFNNLVDVAAGSYKLRQIVDEAYKKKPTERNKYDKEVINVDERVNICYQIFNGDFLRVFPDKEDENDKWITENQYYSQKKNRQQNHLLTSYFQAVNSGIKSGGYTAAKTRLQEMKDLQFEHGAKIIPSKTKISLEVLYNRFNIFSLLSKICGLLGVYLLVLHLIQIFNQKIRLQRLLKPGTGLVLLVFVIYTGGLALRWYISGHAPWSNGYETMLYVGWATLLSGFIFLKRSQITLAITTILASLILMVAGMSWMNPEITNLVPVLKSYWLIVHVAVITASYGFLGIAALLGFFNLILMLSRSPRNLKNASFTIVELSIIIELSLITGLILLTIGAFIGGVWANESWGRYWGWDPKETWALVTILVYSFIIHLRKVPGMYNNFVLSTLALVGFSSVLMTFFGVNYYLSGMHSYGQGDPPPVPSFVYIALVVIFSVIVAASFSEKRYGSAEKILKLEE